MTRPSLAHHSSRGERPLDLVVFGATGFTGGLTAEVIAQRARHQALRWALAGRNLGKLESVRASLAAQYPECADLPLLQAHAEDPASMGALAARTNVLLSTVGPFTEHGLVTVAACVDHATDYIDVTGEIPFWRTAIERFHQRAEAAQTLIVPCCGFESVPIDLGVQFTLGFFSKDDRVRIRGYVTAHGELSSGTWRSAILAVANLRTWHQLANVQPFNARPHLESSLSRWALPLASIDPCVVRRSLDLRDPPQGKVEYEHYITVSRLWRATALVAGLGVLTAMAHVGPARRWLLGRFPSGKGPTPEAIARGSFRVTFIAESDRGQRVRTEVRGRDPGYGHTSIMLAEAALALVEDRKVLPAQGGVLTPAVALGQVLRARLQRSGMEFVRL